MATLTMSQAAGRKSKNLLGQGACGMPLQQEEASQMCRGIKNREDINTCPEYLNKDVNASQGRYDNGKNDCGGNDNYHGGERDEEGEQEHEYGGRQSLVYHVDVLGEAVDDASYRRGIKKRLGRVKFVGEQVMVQLLGCADVPHC